MMLIWNFWRGGRGRVKLKNLPYGGMDNFFGTAH